jgi:MFS family permease
MPISSMIGLPFSGWLVSRFDSRVPLTVAFVLVAVSIAGIGLSTTTWFLIVSICAFSFSTRMFNIALNTQALTLQNLFERKINGSFHGLWSTGGILGVAFTTLLVAFDVSISVHLVFVSVLTIIVTFIFNKGLIRNDRAKSGNKLALTKPDPYIMFLGLIVFFAAVCEGGMFDWSGVYFREVVKVEIFTWGYLTFMVCMALSRFASDWLIENIGMARTYLMSSSLIVAGILLAIVFPQFWPSMFGFCLVGLGTAAVIPMTYTLAGKSQKYSPGMAISIIATYSIVGMLIGPPMIGYLAHGFNLRIAFIAFAVAGLMLTPISQMFFRYTKNS